MVAHPMATPRPQKPLELILARNLLTSISTPGFLLDAEAAVVFYNEAAAALLGRSFEEAGPDGGRAVDRRRSARSTCGGTPLEVDALTTTEAIRKGRPAHATFTIKAAGGDDAGDRGQRASRSSPPRRARPGAMILFWPLSENGGSVVKLKVWGARGSVPAPGPQMNRYGGNTSCVQLTPRRRRGADPRRRHRDPQPRASTSAPAKRIHILLTHLHLDHIQGLMFFPPCFRAGVARSRSGARPRPRRRSRTGSPATSRRRSRRSRSASCPARSPSATRPATEWELGGATIRAEAVTHRGPTLGYRITDGETTVAYIPDHEPALGAPLEGLEPEWISGFDLARDADLLIHDCQYSDEEYPEHVGWGHSALSDTLTFARRVEAQRLMMFHHDPLHSDEFLDDFGAAARADWARLGGDASQLELAAEGGELEVGTAADCPACPRLRAGLSTAGTTGRVEVSTAG